MTLLSTHLYEMAAEERSPDRKKLLTALAADAMWLEADRDKLVAVLRDMRHGLFADIASVNTLLDAALAKYPAP